MIEDCLGRQDGKVIFPEGFISWPNAALADCVSAIKGTGWTAAAIADVVGCTRASIDELMKSRKRVERGYRTTRFEFGLRIAVLWWIVTRVAPVENAPPRRSSADRSELSRCVAQVRSALVSRGRPLG